ncbi:MAG: cache domain-containing protein [Chloroflexota bacterium]
MEITSASPTLVETTTRFWNSLPSLWKALLPAVSALLIVLVPANLLIGSRIYAVTTDNLRAQQTAILADLGSTFEEFLNQQSASLISFAASDKVQTCATTGCADQAHDVFGTELQRELQDPNGYYVEIGFIDNSGNEITRAVRGSGNAVNIDKPTFSTDPAALHDLTAINNTQVYVFPISRDPRYAASESYQSPAVRLAAPIIVNGQHQGYATAVLNLDDFFAQNFVFSDQQETFLLDSNGCLLASSDGSRRAEMYRTWSSDPGRTCYTDLQLQNWDTTVQRYHDNVLSTKPLHGILSNSGQTWTLVVQQPAATAYAQANALQALLTVVHLITIVFVAALIIAADRATGRLLRSVQARSEAHARDIRFNPYIIEGALVDSDARLFFGRIAALARVIGAGVIGGDDVLIEGNRHVGKTSLLRQVERRLRERRVSDPTYWYWPVSLNLQGIPAQTFYATLMEHILRDVEDHQTRTDLRYHVHPERYQAEDFREDISEVLDLPNIAGRQTRMVLCLDNIHVWFNGNSTSPSGYDQAFVETFRNVLTAVGNQLKLIATGTHLPPDAFGATVSIVTLGPLDSGEAQNLILQPVKEYYKFKDEAENLILTYSDQLPMEIQRLSRYAVQTMLEQDAASITAVHVERALQRAIDDWEPTYRLLWYGGTDRTGHIIERFSDELHTQFFDLATHNTPIPPSLLTIDPSLRSRLDEITYIDTDDRLWLTAIFKAWLLRTLR